MEGVGQSGLATDLSEISARVESSPFLREFSGSFPDLTASGQQDLGQSFEALASVLTASLQDASVESRSALDATDEQVWISFGIIGADETRFWSLELGRTGCRMVSERAQETGLELLLREETWWELATGSLSLVGAFLLGRMRVRGDLNLARTLVAQLRQS